MSVNLMATTDFKTLEKKIKLQKERKEALRKIYNEKIPEVYIPPPKDITKTIKKLSNIDFNPNKNIYTENQKKIAILSELVKLNNESKNIINNKNEQIRNYTESENQKNAPLYDFLSTTVKKDNEGYIGLPEVKKVKIADILNENNIKLNDKIDLLTKGIKNQLNNIMLTIYDTMSKSDENIINRFDAQLEKLDEISRKISDDETKGSVVDIMKNISTFLEEKERRISTPEPQEYYTPKTGEESEAGPSTMESIIEGLSAPLLKENVLPTPISNPPSYSSPAFIKEEFNTLRDELKTLTESIKNLNKTLSAEEAKKKTSSGIVEKGEVAKIIPINAYNFEKDGKDVNKKFEVSANNTINNIANDFFAKLNNIGRGKEKQHNFVVYDSKDNTYKIGDFNVYFYTNKDEFTAIETNPKNKKDIIKINMKYDDFIFSYLFETIENDKDVKDYLKNNPYKKLVNLLKLYTMTYNLTGSSNYNTNFNMIVNEIKALTGTDIEGKQKITDEQYAQALEDAHANFTHIKGKGLRKRKAKRGKGIIYYHNPDELKRLLKIVIGTIEANNASREEVNNGFEIIDTLLKTGNMSKKEHKKYFNFFVDVMNNLK